MKILLVHNFYGSSAPSGENLTVELEKNTLIDQGHEVFEFYDYSDRVINGTTIDRLSAAVSVPWSLSQLRKFNSLLKEINPDIIHVHNTFPLISPSIFYANTKAPFVVTLHNYRLFCPAAIPMRNNKVCTDCFSKTIPYPSLIHSCYRASFVATLPIFSNVSIHKALNTWNRKVSKFIVFSQFQKDMIVQAGISANLVEIRPNYYDNPPIVSPFENRDNTYLYIGRLSEEKGINTLIEAWRILGEKAPQLNIVGHGPLFSTLLEEQNKLNITVHGYLAEKDKLSLIKSSKALLIPSLWFEGQPASLIEALANGLVVGVSNIGALPSFVGNGESGFIFEPGNAKSLASAVIEIESNYALAKRLSEAARNKFDSTFTKEISIRKLNDIYTSAFNISERRVNS